ncbi:MAG: NADH-quinone oxidoreductase subunit L [Candidatus Coatesbacteria bacterium]
MVAAGAVAVSALAAAPAITVVEAPGYLWLIPGLPLAAFVVIGLVTRPWRLLSAAVGVVAIGLSFVFSLWTFIAQVKAGPDTVLASSLPWFTTGTLHPMVGLQVDPLSAVMLLVVTTVALMVQIYSLGYMAGEAGLSRFYAYLSLFCAAMLGLVMAHSFVQLFVCWELVGLCSYLLIGFWYDRDAPAFAAKKAFVTTRLGDLGFLLGVLLVCTTAGSFEFSEVQAKIGAGLLDPRTLTLAALLLFCGAVGKSAQVPLHVWLPDAMEGPTPVSALIHAATMVAAGVYMVARFSFIFHGSPDAMATVAVVGGITAFFAATIALVQDDIKRVLAYSTISQLGYMMLALGAGSVTAGMFHLFTHAFFKALLFLGAGAVIHAVHTNDMWEMGGLRKSMPWTFWTFAIGSLALAGFFPFSGFFSKDEILVHVLAYSPALFALAVAGSFCTAFYMGRVVFVAFLGTARGGGAAHAHEAPLVMRGPLVILAGLSIAVGWWVWDFARFVYAGEMEEVHIHLGLAAATQLVPLAGLLLAAGMYVYRSPDPEALSNRFPGVYNLLRHRYYVDEAYDWLIDRVVMRFSAGIGWFDRNVVDGAVNGVAWLARQTGAQLRYLQTGRVQHYAAAVFGGVALLLLLARLGGAR